MINCPVCKSILLYSKYVKDAKQCEKNDHEFSISSRFIDLSIEADDYAYELVLDLQNLSCQVRKMEAPLHESGGAWFSTAELRLQGDIFEIQNDHIDLKLIENKIVKYLKFK